MQKRQHETVSNQIPPEIAERLAENGRITVLPAGPDARAKRDTVADAGDANLVGRQGRQHNQDG